METKIIEIRDVGTYIPVLCVEMKSNDRIEQYHLRRLGFGDRRLIQVVHISRKVNQYDPFAWADRTMFRAHEFILNNWDELRSGDVVDVEYILGEKDVPKQSERLTQ